MIYANQHLIRKLQRAISDALGYNGSGIEPGRYVAGKLAKNYTFFGDDLCLSNDI